MSNVIRITDYVERVEIWEATRLPEILQSLVAPKPLVVVHTFLDGKVGPVWSGYSHAEAIEAARIWAAGTRMKIIDTTLGEASQSGRRA